MNRGSMLGLLIAALFEPISAMAADDAAFVGLGSTIAVSQEPLQALLTFQQEAALGPIGFAVPSVDIRLGQTIVQLHLIESIGVIATGDALYLGGNAFTTPLSKGLGKGGHWEIFGGLGGSFDVYTAGADPLLTFGPVAPIGIRFGHKGARFAAYVMPGLDVALVPATSIELIPADNRLMASVWF